MLYKLGDAFAATLTTAFLIKGLGFSLGDVAMVNKGLGLVLWLRATLATVGTKTHGGGKHIT